MRKKPFHLIIVGTILLVMSIGGIIGRTYNWRLLIYIPFLVSSIGILFLKNWARVLAILILGIFTIETIVILRNVTSINSIVGQAFGILLFILPIYYLTRTQIKQLFQK